MGKATVEFLGALNYKGVCSNILFKILNSLEGKTVIQSFDYDSVKDVYSIGIENIRLEDGTTIRGKHIALQNSIGPYAVFDGLEIIPSQQPGQQPTGVQTTNSLPTGNNAIRSPYNMTTPIQYTGLYPTFIPVTIDMSSLKLAPICQCGKDNHGFAKHADWCDIKD